MAEADLSQLRRHNASTLSARQARKLYDRDHILWVRLAADDRAQCGAYGPEQLRAQFDRFSATYKRSFSVENAAGHDRHDLTAEKVFGSAFLSNERHHGAFYVSTILQRDPPAVAAFLADVPFGRREQSNGSGGSTATNAGMNANGPGNGGAPRWLASQATHDDGIWLFVGANPPLTR